MLSSHINAHDYDERTQMLLEYQQSHQPYFLNLVASYKPFLIFEFLILIEHRFIFVTNVTNVTIVYFLSSNLYYTF